MGEEILLIASELLETVLGPIEVIHKNKLPNPKYDPDDEESKEKKYIIEEEKEVMYEIIKTVKGSELLGLSYVYPLAEQVPKQMELEAENSLIHSTYQGNVELNARGRECNQYVLLYGGVIWHHLIITNWVNSAPTR